MATSSMDEPNIVRQLGLRRACDCEHTYRNLIRVSKMGIICITEKGDFELFSDYKCPKLLEFYKVRNVVFNYI